ncbi:hypothetical protein [Phenylobacterium sp.]|uniref:hypothetical protein n=1 Tax=Phenylobacterium sp. TaxID=1871053 RepID=UPI0035ADEEFF
MILIEAQAAVDAAGTVETLYLSTAHFITRPTDTPANVAFQAALTDPGKIGLSAYGDGRTSGGTRLQAGEITVTNVDGRFDRWLNYSFGGRPVTIREGDAGGAYPADFPILFRGTAEGVTGDLSQLVIRLRDKQYLFDKAVLTNRYAGSNVLPDGLEGVSSDLKDQLKGRVFGAPPNIAPPCVNTSKLTFQVNDGPVADIAAVYDKGDALTKGADYATGAALNAATGLTPGYFYTCLAEGYFRLGGAAAGQITADPVEGETAAERTTAQVLKHLALASGLSSEEVSAADVEALDLAAPGVVGLRIEGETTFQEAMDQVAASAGAYYAFDDDGVLRMGQLQEPAGEPVVTLGRDAIRGLERRLARDNGQPLWKVTVRYGRIWTVQDTDVAGEVSADRRAYLAQEYRSAVAEDETVKDQFLLADEATIDTLLADEAAAQAEADRLLALQRGRREIYDVTVEPKVRSRYGVQLMKEVRLKLDRFGLSAGKDFRVIGIRAELGRRRVILTVWG